VSYSADILKNNLEIGFSISSPVVAEEDKYKVERLNLLENIINSLEFF